MSPSYKSITLVSVVIPIFNEAEALPILIEKLQKVLAVTGSNYEIIFVNDGSKDSSAQILSQAAREDPRLKVLTFSRNFGHQAAITAGLDFASGDAVAVMDADLQDPPELLSQMVELIVEGYDVVSAQRVSRSTDTYMKRKTAAVFYWLMRHMVDERILPEVADFRMFSRPALMAIRTLREQHRFMRGMVAWLGLKEAVVGFHRAPRVAGETKYPILKMMRFAWTAISSFSALPLRLSITAGLLLTFLGVAYFSYAMYVALVTGAVVRGWTSIVALQCLFSGGTLLALGLAGDYIARIYEETKGRPLYVVSDLINIPTEAAQIRRAIVLPVVNPSSAVGENSPK